MNGKLIKGGLTVLGAVIVSTLGIFASDSLRGIDRNLVGLSSMNGGVCRQGMVLTNILGAQLCVDLFEASASVDCPNQNPNTILQSQKNVSTDNCFAISAKEKSPWRFVSLSQAQRMCAEAGKRLPTSDEWYRLALGTKSEKCVIKGGGVQNTRESECVSAKGMYDMIGNVWEWVDETVTNNMHAGRKLPNEGYVASVDASGVAISTDDKGSSLYENDYFWSKEEGVFGMIRGGFYSSGDDAGLYTVNASVPTDFATQGVGFRCVEDVV